jgi:hypothetical protein
MEELTKPNTGLCINDQPMPGNSIGPEVKVGTLYDIKDVYVCKCGEKHFNIGLPLKLNFVECYKCRETLSPTNHWCHSSRFEPTSV